MFLLAAISIGFLGSFHCIGMCGPIALAIPVKRNSRLNIIYGSLAYNAGRLLTYSLIGLLFGLLGQGVVLAGFQNTLSIVLGAGILLLLFVPAISKLSSKSKIFFKFLEKIKSVIRKLFGIHTLKAVFLIGLLNGLLPCGLVYLGVAGAIATGSAIKGALFMLFFGLGTTPAMFSITLLRDSISLRFRERIKKTIPVFVGIMAVLLILRGMNLGIPYISPAMKNNAGVCHHECCHQNK